MNFIEILIASILTVIAIKLIINVYYFNTLSGATYVLKSQRLKNSKTANDKAVDFLAKKNNRKCLEILAANLPKLTSNNRLKAYSSFENSKFQEAIPTLLNLSNVANEDITPSIICAKNLGATTEQIIRSLPIDWVLNEGKMTLLKSFDISEKDIFYTNKKSNFGEKLTPEQFKLLISRMYAEFPQNLKHRFWDVIVDKRWQLLDNAWKITSEGNDFSINYEYHYEYDEGEVVEIPADPAWGGGQNFMTVREPSHSESENWQVLKIERDNKTSDNPK